MMLFLREYEEKKAHNMLLSVLNLRFKNLSLMSLFIGLEQNKAIVLKYDKKKPCIPCLNVYHHLHPLFENVALS
jgi:hypothetical protein